MRVTFIHDGDRIDHTPTVDLAAGEVVVLEDLIGVTKRPVPANTPGALAVTGVFEFPKATGAIAAGKTVYWKASPGEVTPTASGNKLLGKSVRSAGNDDPTVRVRLGQ